MKTIFVILLFFSFNIFAKTSKTIEQQIEEASKLGLAYIMTNLYLKSSKYSFEKCKNEYAKYSSKKRNSIGDSINEMIYRNFLTEVFYEQYTDEEYGENVTKITLASMNKQINNEFSYAKEQLDLEIEKRKLKKFCKESIKYIKSWKENSQDASLQILRDIKKFNPNFKIDNNRLDEKLATQNDK
jgi:hypothetical protein